MPIFLGRNSILLNIEIVLIPRTYLGRIDRVLVPQRAVQSRAASATLPQREVQQLLQPHGMAALEVHL